jgi:hypothetical protein
MAQIKLKLIMERSSSGGSGGCGAYIPGGEQVEGRQDTMADISALLSGIRETFGDRVDISVMDPRASSPFSTFSGTGSGGRTPSGY